MAGSVGYTVVSTMKESIESYVSIAYALLAVEVVPLFRIFVILAITILGICLILGKFKDSAQEVLAIIIFTPFMLEIVSNYNLYNDLIITPLIETTKSLMGIFVSLKTSSKDPLLDMFLTMDNKFSLVFNAVEVASESAGYFDAGSIWIVTGFLAVLYGFLYIVFTTLILYGIFAFYIYAILGPIALMCCTMKKTRFIFWSWVRQMLNYLLIPIITSIIMGITVSVLDMSANVIAEMDLANDGVFNKQIGLAFLIGCISLFFHLKAPELSNGLSGGQAGGIGGFYAGLGALAAGTKMVSDQAGLSGGLNILKNGAGNAAKSAANALGSRYGGRAYSALKGVLTNK
jgi:type IV secretory pathway VirB6-like protein